MAVTRLTVEQRQNLLEPLAANGWTMGDRTDENRDAISKDILFADFNEAFSYMTRIALKAETLGHHPEWSNVYNRLSITWSTHDCNGLSLKDIEMATFCDAILLGK